MTSGTTLCSCSEEGKKEGKGRVQLKLDVDGSLPTFSSGKLTSLENLLVSNGLHSGLVVVDVLLPVDSLGDFLVLVLVDGLLDDGSSLLSAHLEN